MLDSRTLSAENFIRAVLDSAEYKNLAAARRLKDPALLHLHDCRKAAFKSWIPAADVVLDLGGAANDSPEGALFALGYPHAPRKLIIVDLPPDRRFECHTPETARHLRAERGTEVEYVYGSMTDLGFLREGSIDLVISGESIEHITEPEADAMCREVFRVLRPGGHFCLDTPNALLTRLQSPEHLIHPEHMREYRVGELRQKLTAHGFEIRQSLGICAMENSARTGLFDYAEMTNAAASCANPEFGYAMFFDAVKPVVTG